MARQQEAGAPPRRPGSYGVKRNKRVPCLIHQQLGGRRLEGGSREESRCEKRVGAADV